MRTVAVSTSAARRSASEAPHASSTAAKSQSALGGRHSGRGSARGEAGAASVPAATGGRTAARGNRSAPASAAARAMGRTDIAGLSFRPQAGRLLLRTARPALEVELRIQGEAAGYVHGRVGPEHDADK